MNKNKELYYQEKILLQLLPGAVMTNEQLSQAVGITSRSVRTKLELIESYLSEHDLGSLERKPRAGVRLIASEPQKKKIARICGSSSGGFITDLDQRRNEMIRCIFCMKKSDILTMANLAEKMYLSIPTAKRYFDQTVEWFAQWHIDVRTVRNRGITIVCQETDYRKALRSFIREHYADNLEAAVKIFLPGLDSGLIRKQLIRVEERWRLEFSDYSLQDIWLFLCIAVYRIQVGCPITEFAMGHYSELAKNREYDFSLAVFEAIAEQRKIVVPILEAARLAEIILCSNVVSEPEDTRQNNVSLYEKKFKEFVWQLIECMSVVLGEDLNNDESLYNGLFSHLRPAIFRMRYGYVREDNSLSYIKNEYKHVYRAAWSTIPLFEKYFDIKVTDAELICIALYVQVALERRKKPFRAALVTTLGNGYTQLLCMRLKKAFPRAAVFDVMRHQDFKAQSISEYDVIFTTSGTLPEQGSVVRVPDIFSDEAELNLKRRVQKLLENHATVGEMDPACFPLLSPELMLIQSEMSGKDEILRAMTSLLEERGYVGDGYYKTVIEREAATSTAIGNGVAIPHGYASGVNQPKVCVCTLKNPILWDHEMVDVIFMLAVRMNTLEDLKDIQLFYKSFIKLTDTDEKVGILRKIETGAEMYKYLIGWR